MKIPLAYAFVLLIMIVYAACLTKQNARSQSTSKNINVERGVAQKIPPEMCGLLSGDWGAFETPQGTQKQMCGELPCGYAGPFKLTCEDGIITGSVLLSVDSKTGKVYRAPIDATWEEERLVLKYTNNQGCFILYRASIKGTELQGEYSKENCGDKNTRGEFLAKKPPLRWLKSAPTR